MMRLWMVWSLDRKSEERRTSWGTVGQEGRGRWGKLKPEVEISLTSVRVKAMC
jgi:hypothetical protein